MARGDMRVENLAAKTRNLIINREPFSGVSMTINFTNVSTTDSETGEKVVRAGTPIDKDGVPVSATPWTGAVGILLEDVFKKRPQGTILTEAYIHTGRAQTNSGLTYDSALVTAMMNAGNRIRFEEPIIAGTTPAS